MSNKNSFKQAIFKSPLIGGSFSYIIFSIYWIIILNINNNKSFFILLWNYIKISPLIILIFLIISYLYFIPVSILVQKIKEYYYSSEEFGWFLTFVTGLIIGLIIAIINYKYTHNMINILLIILSFSFGSLLNATLLSILMGKIKNE